MRNQRNLRRLVDSIREQAWQQICAMLEDERPLLPNQRAAMAVCCTGDETRISWLCMRLHRSVDQKVRTSALEAAHVLADCAFYLRTSRELPEILRKLVLHAIHGASLAELRIVAAEIGVTGTDLADRFLFGGASNGTNRVILQAALVDPHQADAERSRLSQQVQATNFVSEHLVDALAASAGRLSSADAFDLVRYALRRMGAVLFWSTDRDRAVRLARLACHALTTEHLEEILNQILTRVAESNREVSAGDVAAVTAVGPFLSNLPNAALLVTPLIHLLTVQVREPEKAGELAKEAIRALAELGPVLRTSGQLDQVVTLLVGCLDTGFLDRPAAAALATLGPRLVQPRYLDAALKALLARLGHTGNLDDLMVAITLRELAPALTRLDRAETVAVALSERFDSFVALMLFDALCRMTAAQSDQMVVLRVAEIACRLLRVGSSEDDSNRRRIVLESAMPLVMTGARLRLRRKPDVFLATVGPKTTRRRKHARRPGSSAT